MSRSCQRFGALGATLLLATLAGCATNLGAIQEFGRLSSDGAGYTRLTSDYVASPQVQRDLLLTTDADSERASLDRAATERAAQEKPLLALHLAVENYMKAVADLAGDQVPTYDKELGAMVDAAAGSAMPKNQVAALKSVSALVADAATDLYRRRKLRDVVERANAPLQEVLQGLDTTVAAYAESVAAEQQRFEDRYRYLIRSARPAEPVAGQIVTDLYVAQGRSYAPRLKAIEAYRKIIRAIADGHQSLYDHRDRLDSAETLDAAKAYAMTIYKAYKLVAQARPADGGTK